MHLLDSTTQFATAGLLVAIAIAYVLSQETGLVKWLQKKNYQYEVTFALYMLTPTEKFIFNSILFLTLSLLTLAVVLYLPNHILIVSRRAYYYFAGDAAASHLGGTASKASEAVLGAASGLAGAAFQAAVNSTAAASSAVSQAAENLGWT